MRPRCLKIAEKVSFHIFTTLRAKRATFTYWTNFGEFLKNWSFGSNSATRQVNFNRTKIGRKCQNWKIEMRHFEWFSNNVESSNLFAFLLRHLLAILTSIVAIRGFARAHIFGSAVILVNGLVTRLVDRWALIFVTSWTLLTRNIFVPAQSWSEIKLASLKVPNCKKKKTVSLTWFHISLGRWFYTPVHSWSGIRPCTLFHTEFHSFECILTRNQWSIAAHTWFHTLFHIALHTPYYIDFHIEFRNL